MTKKILIIFICCFVANVGVIKKVSAQNGEKTILSGQDGADPDRNLNTIYPKIGIIKILNDMLETSDSINEREELKYTLKMAILEFVEVARESLGDKVWKKELQAQISFIEIFPGGDLIYFWKHALSYKFYKHFFGPYCMKRRLSYMPCSLLSYLSSFTLIKEVLDHKEKIKKMLIEFENKSRMPYLYKIKQVKRCKKLFKIY